MNVREGNIYTRVGDTNTPLDKTADINHTEFLWRKRFGLTSSPIFRFQKLLRDRCNWVKTDSDPDISYYSFAPEFTIRLSSTDDYIKGHYFFSDYWMLHKPIFDYMSFNYYSTEIERHPIVIVDDNRFAFPFPNASIIKFPDFTHPIRYYYFSEDSIRFDMLDFLDDKSYPADAYRTPLLNMIPVFTSDKERHSFEMTLSTHNYKDFKEAIEKMPDYYKPRTGFHEWMNINETEARLLNDDLKVNTLVVDLVKKFRGDERIN